MADIDRDKLEKLIFDGLKEGYEDSYSFTGEVNSIVKPEYLVTVNIAKKIKQINDENKSWGDPLIIKIEEPTRQFATSCVPPDANLTIFDSNYREVHNPSRNGKIDIAIYTHSTDVFDKIPYAAIEVKDFISTRGELKADIVRNLYYLHINDSNTGASRLKQTYLVCIHEHKGAITTDQKQAEITKLTNDYNKYLAKFNSSGQAIFTVKGETVAEYLIKEDDKFLPTEIQEGIAEVAIHFIGILIRIEKNNTEPTHELHKKLTFGLKATKLLQFDITNQLKGVFSSNKHCSII